MGGLTGISGLGGLGALVRTGIYGAYLIFDTFTDADGTSIPSHTPDKDQGNAWIEQQGIVWDIYGNKLDDTGTGDGSDLCSIDCGSTGHSTEVILNGLGNNGPGVLVRFATTTSHWLCQVNFSSNAFQLYENGGSYSLKATWATGNIDSNTDYVVKVTIADDDVFHGELDGVEKGTHTSSGKAGNTSGGLRATPPNYDDFNMAAA